MSARTILLVALAAGALSVPGLASGKGIKDARVCGADACAEVAAGRGDHELLGGPPSAAAPKPAPFYRLRIAVGDGYGRVVERMTFAYVPSRGQLRPPHGTWTDVSARATRVLTAATQGLAPLPPNALRRWDTPQPGASLPPAVYRAAEEPPPADEGAPVGTIALVAAGFLLLLAALFWLRRRNRDGSEGVSTAWWAGHRTKLSLSNALRAATSRRTERSSRSIRRSRSGLRTR